MIESKVKSSLFYASENHQVINSELSQVKLLIDSVYISGDQIPLRRSADSQMVCKREIFIEKLNLVFERL